MSLSGSQIREAVAFGEIQIDPYSDQNISTHSYRLHLGETILQPRKGGVVDLSNLHPEDDFKRAVVGPEGYILKPKEMICWLTQEEVKLPLHIAGVLDGISLFAQYGIMPVSGSREVSPGSEGPLVLEIANLGSRPCRLSPGLAIAKILFTSNALLATAETIRKR